MIKTLRKQLFNSPILLLPLVFIPLGGFLVYSIFLNQHFFTLVFSAIFFVIVFFVIVRKKTILIKSRHAICRQDFLEQANLLESDIKKEWKSVEAVHKKMVDYDQLKHIAEKLNDSFTIHDASKILSAEVSRLFGQKDATVILYLFHSKTQIFFCF